MKLFTESEYASCCQLWHVWAVKLLKQIPSVLNLGAS